MAERIPDAAASLAADRVVDAARCPVILTDAERRILTANAQGTDALGSARVVVRRNDQLVPAMVDDQLLFMRAHQAVASRTAASRQLRLTDSNARLGALATLVRLNTVGATQAVVAVLLAGPTFVRPPDPEHLRALLGVTSAEVQLVVALCNGETLRAYADRRGLSLHTVRTQLRDVYRKTGLGSQLQLVRVALSYAL